MNDDWSRIKGITGENIKKNACTSYEINKLLLFFTQKLDEWNSIFSASVQVPLYTVPFVGYKRK